MMAGRRIASVIVALAMTGCAGTGLHNSTKAFTPSLEMRPSDWNDPAELERTWRAALVRIPGRGAGYLKTTMNDLIENRSSIQGRWPTVIYMHGCTGIWSGTYTRINLLAKNGYAVIAPASFAREKYPKSCDPENHTGGLYRPTLKMRQNDAGYAIAKAKKLPWVDRTNVFLMGLSEGGITTATFLSKAPGRSLRARIVEGWTCRAGWHEYRGIKAPDSEPVLTLVGLEDPWFQNSYNKGSCTGFLDKSNGSKSVVYSKGYLRWRHELLEDKSVQRTVIDFLKEHTSQ